MANIFNPNDNAKAAQPVADELVDRAITDLKPVGDEFIDRVLASVDGIVKGWLPLVEQMGERLIAKASVAGQQIVAAAINDLKAAQLGDGYVVTLSKPAAKK
jgi:ABC-type xylose transport system substrate-binding protein